MGRTAKPWKRKQDGHWYCTHDGKPVKIANSDASKKEVNRAFHALKAKPLRAGDKYAFTDLAEKYLEWYKANRAESSYITKRKALESFCLSNGRDIVTGLHPDDVSDWLDSHPTWSSSTKNTYLACVRACLNWAVKKRYLAENPIRGCEAPPQKARPRPMSDATYRLILKHAEPELRDFVTLLRETGCRPQDIDNLEAKNIDWHRRCWICEEHKTDEDGTPKVIWFPESVVPLLERQLKKHPEGPLLRSPRGCRWTRASTCAAMQRVKRRVTLPNDATLALLRHTFATDALERGLTMATVAALLGHKSITMVMKHYGHLGEKSEHMNAAVNKIRARKK